MRFVGFTHLKNAATAVCSIAWLAYPGQKIDKSYTTPDYCSPGFDLVPPGSYPPKQRTLNPPGVNQTDWDHRLKYPDWEKDPSKIGSIYPLDMRSVDDTDTSLIFPDSGSSQIIAFDSRTSFNGIRTNFSDIPYLLQDPQLNSKRCNFSSLNHKDLYSYQNEFSPTPTFVCQHVLQFPFRRFWWTEFILVNNRIDGAAHPIHQHGGWFWIVGGGKYNHSITREFIQDHKLYYNNAPNSVPKDVIQVPAGGYAILRTKLDNPGNFIFHCHIDFHLSIGMGLVLQFGEFGDWTTGPLAENNQHLNQSCNETPPSILAAKGDTIDWFFTMPHATRCLLLDQTVHFVWDNPHNVNYIGTGDIAKEIWEKCSNKTAQQHGYKIDTSPWLNPPNYSQKLVETGWHYFFCGVDFPVHCGSGMKARIKVVENLSKDCPYHVY